MRKFGLIGYPLGHSFSKKYFTEKFLSENIADAQFELYELEQIVDFPAFLVEHPDLAGLSVTIPHKQNIIPYLDEIEPEAALIGAVNAVKVSTGKCTGFNTDIIGFRESLKAFCPKYASQKALILGTGGAAKAVQAALKQLQIPYKLVSRNPESGDLIYEKLTPAIIKEYTLVINSTPLGTFPEVNSCPPIPYRFLSAQHYLFDLVYNPAETQFLKNGKENGAKVKNGYEMLVLQAEAAWQIWNS